MSDQSPIETKKILLVEDDQQLQASYLKLFQAENYTVIQAFTGEQGLELAEKERPNIILLDIMLQGGTNGFDVLENLKKNRDLFNIPVLMLTNLDSERKLALSIGAVDYLVKANTSIDVLLEKVRSYIEAQPASMDDSQFTAPRTESPVATPESPTTPPPEAQAA